LGGGSETWADERDPVALFVAAEETDDDDD